MLKDTEITPKQVLNKTQHVDANDWEISWTNHIKNELKSEKQSKKSFSTNKMGINTYKSQINNNQEMENDIPKSEQKLSEKRKTLILRTKPSVKDISSQKYLEKVATKGVTNFFNVVRSQQESLKIKANCQEPFKPKEDYVMKNIDKTKFLNVLLGKGFKN